MINLGQPHPLITLPDAKGVMRTFDMGQHYIIMRITSDIHEQVDYNEIRIYDNNGRCVYDINNGADQCAHLLAALRIVAEHLAAKAGDYVQD